MTAEKEAAARQQRRLKVTDDTDAHFTIAPYILTTLIYASHTPSQHPTTQQRHAARLARQRAQQAAVAAWLRAAEGELQRLAAAHEEAGKVAQRNAALRAAVAKEVEAAYAPQLATMRAMRAEVSGVGRVGLRRLVSYVGLTDG